MIDRLIDRIVEALSADSAPELDRWAVDLWKGVEPDTTDFLHRFEAAMVLAALLEEADDRRERYGLVEPPNPYSTKPPWETGEPFGAPWWEAVFSPAFTALWTEQIDVLRRKAPTLLVAWGAARTLAPELRQKAWFLSGVTARSVVERVRETMIEIRSRGGSQSEFIQATHAQTGKTGAELETVWRTNLHGAASAAKWERLAKPENAGLFPACRYINPDDERARPLHALMRGFVALADDPIWRIIVPPNGFNCRCTWLGVTQRKCVELGLLSADGRPLQSRLFTNPTQPEIVRIAETDDELFVDGRWWKFPDHGFRGNSLINFAP